MYKSNDKELNILTQDIQLEEEALTKCCASEVTMGGNVRFRE